MEQFAIILLCTLLTVGTIYCLIYAGYELVCWIKKKRGRVFCINYGRDGEWHDYIIARIASVHSSSGNKYAVIHITW